MTFYKNIKKVPGCVAARRRPILPFRPMES